jgi:uncharacterized protein YbjT (DUF2867 family)
MASIAVAGATGLVGRAVVAALRDGGHEPVEISRAAGVDVVARRTLAARGDRTRLRASWRGGQFGVAWAGEVLLPDPGARLGPTTVDSWLEQLRR